MSNKSRKMKSCFSFSDSGRTGNEKVQCTHASWEFCLKRIELEMEGGVRWREEFIYFLMEDVAALSENVPVKRAK